ncbi:tRNA (adenosine(37)-N6)-threonylcarbamoyltransferase complex ATPase subunit type 1 TsaE [Proteiniclasticum ruminis]|jgi:tRNA threonylcarbamoyladenosine biosynthesis protein TsaE|uniref:tRNA (adenosine(37)-N6)-threonylcarbamoyltransferase complex ATPase subunit type 1 TsaE n=1 Tax=Proteiniclasticum ruminis TaxID=398199 RepID=UPI001B5721AE|nr:tRNA (adenosine(37)-N6)-threonylcarbamoyltransferase complex ATPase subunit type 1 TsaE [Proteiniclasticum ruminis]MBP9920988.1 tRNA (adenosine(37)-N6)-threonylcarbamoyltransferase complex ATPase subunit type 1 TsaE [Proteiniclasticum sp.]
MSTFIKKSSSVRETMELGRKLGESLEIGTTVCLTGDLGTGKTHFAKGLAEGLGVKENITSPTFTIVNEYHSGRVPLYHFDVYRVHDPEEVLQVGFEEYIYGNGIALIEWADLIESILPDQFLQVKIEKTDVEDERKITFHEVGRDFPFLEVLI